MKSSRAKLRRAWREFHEENPHVWKLYKKYTRELAASTNGTLSISLITERIRWDAKVKTTGVPFKIANAHRAFYAEKLNKRPEFQYRNGVGRFKTHAKVS